MRADLAAGGDQVTGRAPFKIGANPVEYRRTLGEEIIIANRNEPMVRLEVDRKTQPAWRFGGLKALVLEIGPSFDEPCEGFVDYAPER